MADSFFGFDTSINNGDHLLPPEDDDCVENEEEEYDALNDETFGGLGDDTSTLDDWEQQHEQYAENVEHSKHSEELENSVSRLLLDNGDDDYETNRDESSMFSKSSVWAYTPPSKNGESSFDQSLISSLHKASKAFIQSHTDSNRVLDGFRQSSPSLSLHHSPKQICTVEELEKSLLKQQQQQHQQQQQQQQKVMPRMPQFRQMFQHPGLRMPPQLMPMGLSGMPAPPPGVHLTPQLRHPHLPLPRHPLSVPPPGLVHPGAPPPGHFMPPPPALRHPGLIYPPPVTAGGAAGPFPPNHPFNFQQQQRTPGQQQQQQPQPPQQQQQQRPPQLTQQILQQIQQRQQQQQEFQRRNDNNFQQMQQRQQLQQQQQHQQQFRRDQQQQHGNYQQQQQHHHLHHQHHENVDEYDGLMQTREKQWLLNIQLLQLNTGTPYFDDYYYTMFKERKAKLLQQQQQQQDRLLAPIILDRRFQNHNNNNNQRNRHNSGGDRNNQDDSGGGKTLTPKIYTPLQFENSLGKLQCGSVTAPRKIIDMDVVGTQDGSGDGNSHQSGNNTVVVAAAAVGGTSAVAPTPLPFRDTRRTKQLLLELEVLYGLLLKAEDLRNPMAISNMEKLREIKQKQRLRELELAPTPEQKQEVLRLFKQESEPVVENQHDYIARIVNGLLHEDKFSGYLAIRKGKMLVLRLLPHLFVDNSFAAQLQELWTRTLLGIPFVGRRDTSGDNILPKFLPFFKRFVQNCSIGDVLDVVNALNEVIKQQPENSRMTPLSHQGRAPLYFVLLNRFGVSALVTLLIRTEYLISSDSTSEKQASEWASFLSAWADLSSSVPAANLAQPLEPIPVQIFTKHCNRFPNMTVDKRQILERHLVENV